MGRPLLNFAESGTRENNPTSSHPRRHLSFSRIQQENDNPTGASVHLHRSRIQRKTPHQVPRLAYISPDLFRRRKTHQAHSFRSPTLYLPNSAREIHNGARTWKRRTIKMASRLDIRTMMVTRVGRRRVCPERGERRISPPPGGGAGGVGAGAPSGGARSRLEGHDLPEYRDGSRRSNEHRTRAAVSPLWSVYFLACQSPSG